MRVSIATQAGSSRPNEDWALGTSSVAVVLDGISTVGLDTGCRHGVPWYVAHLGVQLAEELSDAGRALPTCLGNAIGRVAAMHPECDLLNSGTPSSTVSIVRESTSGFEYLVLADSPIVFEGPEGCDVVTDLSVDRVIQDLKSATERYPTGSPEHTESLRRMVVIQRGMRNIPGGYWVAAANPAAADYALTGRRGREEVRAVAVMSDGAANIVTDYQMATWGDVFQILKLDGPQAVIDEVRKVEASDPDGQRWPRFKSGDDATIAFCLPR